MGSRIYIHRLKLRWWLLVLSVGMLAACQSSNSALSNETPQATLTIMGHDSMVFSEEILQAFEDEYGVKIQLLRAGDAGAALNQAILSRENPLADILYGVDNTFLSRALQEDIFETYDAEGLAAIQAQFRLDDSNRAHPINFGDVCLNYDKSYFSENDLAPPDSLEDLPESEYRSLLVVQNPATSSPGLAFMLTTISHYGEDGYLAFWDELIANDVLIVDDWESAYYSEFSPYGGTRPLVVSYGSSPPAEVFFAEEQLEEAPTGVVTGGESCFRQIEFAGILHGTAQRQLAERWIDFMLSVEFQEALPLNMFVYPVNPIATLPTIFEDYAVVPQTTAQVDPDRIAEQREQWIEAWRDSVLR